MENKRYNSMDKYLETINRKFISFPRDEELRNNIILGDVLEPIIEKMRLNDRLFNKLYKKIFFGGSYYDGLKVGAPDEYDIDLLLKFPSARETEICNMTQVEICNSNKPGFVHLFLNKRDGFEKLCEYWRAYLDVNKVLSWMQGVVQRALNNFVLHRNGYIFPGTYGGNLYVKVSQSGPAFTLLITGQAGYQRVNMSVDLVPCFEFGGEMWPKNRFKQNPYSNKFDMSDFFLVPKRPKGVPNYGGRYWRLSFQKQERCLIQSKERLKPALRLLKKMRDVMQQKQISSYFLKTVVMWEAEQQDSNFWYRNSLSYIFMHILKKYQECLNNQKIVYFWNKNYNLLSVFEGDINNISNRLRYVINDVDRNVSQNPAVIVKYILTPDEQKDLFPEVPVEQPGWCTLL